MRSCKQSVDVHLAGLHRRLRGELRERADAPLQRLDLVHHDLRGLLHEAAVGIVVAHQHLFHGQPDRRQRVLHLVRHLARQRLPACQLAQVDQPLRALLQPARHVVEGPDGASDFVVAPRLHARVEIARRQFAQPGGQFLDGPADAVRQVDQQRQRHQPDARRQQHVRALDAAAANRARCSLPPRAARRRISRVRRSMATSPRLSEYDPDLVAVAHQVFQAIALLAGASPHARLPVRRRTP